MESHAHAHHFTVGTQHFDGLFEGDIGARTFDNQPQIIFAANRLAAGDHILNRSVDYRRRAERFGNRETYRDILFQPDHDDIHGPHNARHLYGKEPKWTGTENHDVLTGKKFGLLSERLIGITDRIQHRRVFVINARRNLPQRMTMDFEDLSRHQAVF